MKPLLPSEIQVWYLLPVIRKELARVLVKEEGLSQKDTARLLGVTAAAISQYFKEKRGNDISLDKKMIKEIRLHAKRLKEETENANETLIKLLNHKLIYRMVCDYHKDNDPSIKKNCKLCSQVI